MTDGDVCVTPALRYRDVCVTPALRYSFELKCRTQRRADIAAIDISQRLIRHPTSLADTLAMDISDSARPR